MKESRKVHEAQEVNDYREMLKMVEQKYSNNIAYKFKKNANAPDEEYVNITYKQFIEDIKALSTGLLEFIKERKKVALIGNNRYEWCMSYLAVTTGNMIVVPLDKALPEKEIETLIEQSEAETIIFDKKYEDIMLKIKRENDNVDKLICMDDINNNERENLSDILKQGKKLLESGDTRYENIKLIIRISQYYYLHQEQQIFLKE